MAQTVVVIFHAKPIIQAIQEIVPNCSTTYCPICRPRIVKEDVFLHVVNHSRSHLTSGYILNIGLSSWVSDRFEVVSPPNKRLNVIIEDAKVWYVI